MNAQDYENLIDSEAANYTELNELQSNTSQVQFWMYAKKVIAFISAYLYTIFTDHKQEVNSLIDTTETGHIDWYLTKIRSFQFGDQLVIINNVPTYEVIDPTKQIVARVAYKEIDLGTGFKLEFKVAREVNGLLSQLDTAQLSALSVFVDRVKIPGTWIDVVSLAAPVWRINCNVKLDPLMYNIDGSLISAPAVFPINDAFESFFKSLDFGIRIYNSELTEHVMRVEGIVDFFIVETFVNVFQYVGSFDSEAGYVLVSDSNTISYDYA